VEQGQTHGTETALKASGNLGDPDEASDDVDDALEMAEQTEVLTTRWPASGRLPASSGHSSSESTALPEGEHNAELLNFQAPICSLFFIPKSLRKPSDIRQVFKDSVSEGSLPLSLS